MTYEEALDYIWSTPSPSDSRLATLEQLLNELGNPHKGMKYVHIAGTNGKGSTSALISQILRAAGYKTGLYTSPHLNTINERFKINGDLISDDEFAQITTEVAGAVSRIEACGWPRPTIFSLITAVGYVYFKRHDCDIIVLEVGMGGRLDATNAIENAEVSAITKIGFDHTEFLGNTLREIAAEKAGIIKEGGSVVCYSQDKEVESVVKEACKTKNASLRFANGQKANIKSISLDGTVFDYGKYNNLRISLLGSYQISNAVTALEIAEALIDRNWNISESGIRLGLESAKWPGRLELIRKNPTVLADGTHNPQGAQALTESLKTFFGDKKIKFVIGFLADKDYAGSIEPVLPLAECFYAVAPSSYRALDSEKLAYEIEHHGTSTVPVKTYPNMAKALQAVINEASEDDIICIFGTLYQISEIHAFFGRN